MYSTSRMISPAELDHLMHRAWPGLSNVPIDGWIARLGGGITQRANSVLPIESPRDLKVALEQVETLYREHGLVPTFQISPATQPANLDDLLAARGYESRSPTLVLVAGVDAVLRTLLPTPLNVMIADNPDEEWVDLWWSVDGRGGYQAQDIAHRILSQCPALYASIRDSMDIVATGRLALFDGWGGIYCMAVRENVRRRGYAQAVLRALLKEAVARQVGHVWLQVVENNHGARALYERAGFAPASRYHYRAQQ